MKLDVGSKIDYTPAVIWARCQDCERERKHICKLVSVCLKGDNVVTTQCLKCGKKITA